MIRIAFIGVSHWHAPEYIRALGHFAAKIVGVSDDQERVARQWGEKLSCPAYAPADALLEASRPDLIFAFASHRLMTELAEKLVDTGLPFVMEKPMGIRWEPLAEVARRAEERGLWAGVDLVVRTLPLVQRLLQLRQQGELGTVVSFTYRLLSGGPERYLRAGVPWMLDKREAGGGPLYNFGPHVLDLFLSLTGEPIASLHCQASHRLHHLDIEDYAIISARTPSGALGSMAVGYVCPVGITDKSFSVATTKVWVSSTSLAEGCLHWRDGRVEQVCSPDGEDWAMTYVRETLKRFSTGAPPVAAIGEMVPVLRAINEAQTLADAA